MKAIIFDFDGLILDTETPDFHSWQKVYQAYGLELPLDLWLTFVGGTSETTFEPHDYLEKTLNSKVVITSYSIHYTKLYERSRRTRPAGSPW